MLNYVDAMWAEGQLALEELLCDLPDRPKWLGEWLLFWDHISVSASEGELFMAYTLWDNYRTWTTPADSGIGPKLEPLED